MDLGRFGGVAVKSPGLRNLGILAGSALAMKLATSFRDAS